MDLYLAAELATYSTHHRASQAHHRAAIRATIRGIIEPPFGAPTSRHRAHHWRNISGTILTAVATPSNPHPGAIKWPQIRLATNTANHQAIWAHHRRTISCSIPTAATELATYWARHQAVLTATPPTSLANTLVAKAAPAAVLEVEAMQPRSLSQSLACRSRKENSVLEGGRQNVVAECLPRLKTTRGKQMQRSSRTGKWYMQGGHHLLLRTRLSQTILHRQSPRRTHLVALWKKLRS